MPDDILRQDHRPDIQGLRAVAVLLVIGFHLFPDQVPGGYIGVDVFFVISGYLITAHLYREIATTSRLSVAGFWARRIRRLLPASLLVLAVCALLTLAYVPRTLWDQTLRQIAASTLYVQNWALAADTVDYSAAGNTPTLVQHYWSLSVEEQFYLVWPVLAVAVLLLVRGRDTHVVRRALAVAVGLLAAGSFAYSVLLTSTDPARAYFVTPTRAWEFAAGALLSLVVLRPAPDAVRTALGWAGAAAIVWSGLALTSETPFPGWIAAAPVVGTVVVIATGTGRSRLAVSRLLSLRPATFLGDISYSMYLWHWPLIVVLPYATGESLRTLDKVGVFVATVLLSWASTRWVENPVRRARVLARPAWRSYAFGAAGMVVVLTMVGALRVDLDRDVQEAEAASSAAVADALVEAEPCFGPARMSAESGAEPGCGPVAGPGDVPINPAAVARQNTDLAYPGCQSALEERALRTCDLGETANPTRTVALVGDSHTTHWFSAFDALGKERGWKVVTYARSSCPYTDARRTLPGEPPHRYPLCRRGNAEVERRLLADDSIDTVFVSAYSSAYGWAQPSGGRLDDPATDGFHARWQRLTDSGRQVVVLRDVPAVKDGVNSPDCLVQHPGDPLACATTRAVGLTPDIEADAVTGAPPGVYLVDLTDRFCDDRLCYAVIGDVIVYRDYSHLSKEYSTLLAPYVGQAFDAFDEHAD